MAASATQVPKTTDNSTAHAFTPKVALILVALAFGGLVTQLWQLGDKSLWLDEAFSWAMAERSLSGIVRETRNADVHPPAYYALLHYWMRAFGDSETSLRIPSALAAGGSFLLVGFAGWRVAGLPLAAAAVGLLALNPAALQFTQDVRFYPVIGFLSLAAALCQAWFLGTQRPAAMVLYTVVGIVLMYTHNIGLVVIGVQGLVFGWYGILQWRRGEGVRILVSSACAGAALLIAYGPWYSAILQQIDNGGGYVPEPSITLAGATLRGVLGLRHTEGLWVLFGLPLVAAIALGLYRHRNDVTVISIAAVAAVPVALLVVSYVISPAFDTRHVSSFIPAISFLSALGLLEAFRTVRRMKAGIARLAMPALAVWCGALVVTLGIGMRDWYDAPPYEDWRQVAVDLRAEPGPVLYFPWYLDDPLNYYIRGDERDRLVRIGGEDAPTPPTSEEIGALDGEQGVLVLSHVTEDEEEAVLAVVGDFFLIGEPTEYTDTIWVYRLTPR